MSAKNLSALGTLFTDRRDFYISPNEVRELWTDVAPFTTIISNRGTKNVQDPDYKMFEHRDGFVDQSFSLSGAPAAWSTNGQAGDTIANVTIDGIKGLASTVDASYKNLLLEIYASDKTTYKGVALIVNVSGTTMTLKSYGNPRVANNRCSALADDDVCVVIGNAHGEGTYAPEAWADDLEVVYNSSEIFKTPIEITGTLYQAALRGYSKELERLRVSKNREHKFQKEKAFLHGVRVGGTGMVDPGTGISGDNFQAHLTDADGKTIRTTMGIIPALYRYGYSSGDKQNIFAISQATYAYSNFVDDMEKVFQYIPENGSKIALCGSGALSYWSKMSSTSGFAKNSGWSVQLSDFNRNSLGFNFKTLETPHGNLELVPAAALRGAYRNTMLIIEPSDLEFVQYRAPKFMANIKTDNAYDGVKDMYFSDEGVGITLIEKHSIWNVVP